MPVGTVRGRFELDAPALRTLKDLEKQGIKTQAQMRELGKTIDSVAGADDARRIKEYGGSLTSFRRTAARDLQMYRGEWVETTRVVRREVRLQELAIDRLEAKLDGLGAKTARPNIDLKGVDAALAKVALLREQLNSLSRDRATPRVGIGGGFTQAAGGLAGGGGGGGGGMSTRGGRFLDFGRMGVSPRNLLMGGLAAYAQPLIGGAGALIGSAGSGLLGAGALGAAGFGGAAVGGAGVYATIKTLTAPIQAASKAQAAYNQQVALYGRLSNQARLAKTKLDIAMATAPPGTRDLLRATAGLKTDFRSATRPGQAALLGAGGFGLNRLDSFVKGAGGDAVNRVDRAFGREGKRFASFLTGPEGARFAQQGAGIFDQNLGNVRGAAQNGLTAFLNVMQAARPFFKESTDWLNRWTRGWARGTGDIRNTRDHIRTMTDDLKSWGHLTGAAGKLLLDLMGRSRGPGTSMVDDLTGTLKKWDDWVRGHGNQVDDFFRRSVHSVELLAGGLANVVHTFSQLSSLLQPLLDRFSQLVGLAASLSSTSPFTLPALYGAYRGVRGGIGGGMGAGGVGGAGGGGGAAGGMGGGFFSLRGSPLARPFVPGVGSVGSRYSMLRSGGFIAGPGGVERVAPRGRIGAGLGAAGGLLARGGGAARGLGMRALGGAAGILAPMVLLGGVLGAANATTGGISGRAAGALSGLSMGLIPQLKSNAQIADAGFAGSAAFLNRALHDSHGGLRGQISTLQRIRDTAYMPGGSAEDAPRNARIRKQINEEIAQRRELIRSIRAERDARSQQTARTHFADFQQGFRARVSQGATPAAAMDATVTGVIGDLHHLRAAGARTLSQATLDWVRTAAEKNPALTAEYDKLTAGIIQKFKDLGKNVTIVNGQILDGTGKQWNSIADQISTAARRGVSETSAEFQRLQSIAIGELMMMGFTRADAANIFKNPTLRAMAGHTTGAGQSGLLNSRARAGMHGFGPGTAANPTTTIRNNSRTGDGPGVGGGPTGRGMTGSDQGLADLMGAKAGLEPYARIGRGMGLAVSSGARPGAMTVSGNVSLHSSGDAIDMSGPPGAMLRYARFMSQNYGRGLDELIHTPLGGLQIKNGQHYTYTGAVAQQHFNHVHVGDRTPGGPSSGGGGMPGSMAGGSPGAIALSGRGSRLGGVPGALSTAASAGIAAGMEAAVNAAIGGGGGGGAGPGGKYGKAALAHLWVRAGGNPAVATLMANLATRESGGNPNAINHNTNGSIDRGLWQINSVWGKWSRFGALPNAESAVHVYNTQGPGAWATYNPATDARYLGGFKRGGRFVTRTGRAGLFMAGEGPNREEVIVRPHRPPRKSAGGARTVHVAVNLGHVSVHHTDDVEALAETIGDKVGKKLTALLSGPTDEDLLDG